MGANSLAYLHSYMPDGWRVQVQYTNTGAEYRILDANDNVIPFEPVNPKCTDNIRLAIKVAVKAANNGKPVWKHKNELKETQ